MIEKGLYALLAATPGVTALCSTRIYPRKSPQKADKPYVVYQRKRNSRPRYLTTSSGVADATLQVDCLATTYDAAKALGEAVRAVVDDGLEGVTWDGHLVQDAHWDDDFDDFDEPEVDDDGGAFYVSLALEVWYVP